MKNKQIKYLAGAALLTVPNLASANNGLSGLGDALAFIGMIILAIPVVIAGIVALASKKNKAIIFGKGLLIGYGILAFFVLLMYLANQ